jgi:hypothetical protein
VTGLRGIYCRGCGVLCGVGRTRAYMHCSVVCAALRGVVVALEDRNSWITYRYDVMGQTAEEIGALYGVTGASVLSMLKDRGIPRRRRGRRWPAN